MKKGSARIAQMFLLGAILTLASSIQLNMVSGVSYNYIEGLDAASRYPADWDNADWTRVRKAGKSFVFARATEGATEPDPKFTTIMEGGKAAGLWMGALHTAHPEKYNSETDTDAIAEADYFYSKAKDYLNWGLPPVLDIEKNPGNLSPTKLSAWCLAWVNRIKSKPEGVTPIIYANLDYASQLSGEITKYALWVAWPRQHYTSPPPLKFGNWNSWKYWQHDWHGTVDGITGEVCLDRLRIGSGLRKLRYDAVAPVSGLIAMQFGEIDVLPNLETPGYIESLWSDGCTITSDPGFHVSHIAYNIRSDQSYRRGDIAGTWPLADINFRHALFHCYNQEEIVGFLYKYVATPVRSLVPPSQGGWVNPDVPTHPYNPGDPFTSLAGEHSSCGILKAAGYVFVDDDGSGTVTNADYWLKPDGYPLPNMRLFTPTYEWAPISAVHGAWFCADCNAIGIPLVHDPREFAPYLDLVYCGDFDACMLFWNLDRFPDHLYDMCHSSQDAALYPGRYNYPGINDPILDGLVETLKTSLDHSEKLNAAWEVQERLYDSDASDQALAYMQLHSRIYFNAYSPHLRGIVQSPGFGSDNMWTWLNIRWEPANARIEGTDVTAVYGLPNEPGILNPLSASTESSWTIMRQTMDDMLAVNPYTHEDLPWLAESWALTETPAGPGAMEITYALTRGVEWQDGNEYTAADAKFNWLFLRDNGIPRYSSMWQYIADVEVIDTYTVKVILSATSQFLLYDLAATAALLPPPVWSPLDGKPLDDILHYNPSANTTKPTGAGPRFGKAGGPPNQLYGTGPFIFQSYYPAFMYAELLANAYYFNPNAPCLTEMFHAIGDVDRNGEIWAADRVRYILSYGCEEGDLCYDVDADLNGDDIVDALDGILINRYWGDPREYP